MWHFISVTRRGYDVDIEQTYASCIVDELKQLFPKIEITNLGLCLILVGNYMVRVTDGFIVVSDPTSSTTATAKPDRKFELANPKSLDEFYAFIRSLI